MTATISFYDEDEFPGSYDLCDSLNDVLQAWDSSGLAGTHPTNTGGFYGGTVFSGTSYSFVSSSGNYSFQATSASGTTLDYDFATHTLHGTLETITIGAGLDSSGNVTTPILTFTFDDPLEGDLSDGRENVVHDVIWGLMNASVDGADSSSSVSQGGLIAALEDNGIDVSDSVADIVGVSCSEELLLAA
ncbi:MAG: heme acquisition protein HasA [Tsuneonella suprasediminis]